MINRAKKIGLKQPNITSNQEEISQKLSLIICGVMFILGFLLTK